MKGDIFNCLTAVLTADGSVTSMDQLITAVATTLFVSSVDLLAAKDIAPGKPVRLLVGINQLLTSAGAPTLTFELVQADDAALTDDLFVIGRSQTFTMAELNVAQREPVIVEANPVWPTGAGTPALTNRGRRFLGARLIIATAALTNSTAQFRAYVTPNREHTPKLYPSGWNAVGA